MQIAYALMFFLFVGLCETLRHGAFGLDPADITAIIHGTLTLGALLLLRSDAIYLMHCPKYPLYGNEWVNWTWPRSALGAFLGLLLWVVAFACGFVLSEVDVAPIPAQFKFQTLVLPVFLVVIAESLFFREAVLKAFGGDLLPVYMISTLSVFIFHIPVGVSGALIAAGSGIYYLTLRLIGTNIPIVAMLHGATIILFGEVLLPELSQSQFRSYSVYFISGSAALSLLIFTIFAKLSREAHYA